ncbi:hypothetical protein J4408_02025 [Candidatus Pacearchaeota archaeon]|nr:hypothetical protein [Candidatus Pacearchaeota archaeon]
MSRPFNPDQFDNFVINSSIHKFSLEGKMLSSKRKSHWYLDWEEILNDSYLTSELTGYIVSFIEENIPETKSIIGVPEGATPLGILTQYEWARNHNFARKEYTFSMFRGKIKEEDYKQSNFVGFPKGKTIIIEDSLTTGESLEGAIEKLIRSKVDVIGGVILINREQSENNGLGIRKKNNIPYWYMTNAFRILPKVYEKLNPGKEVGKKIEKEYEMYGTERSKRIKLVL